jgi:hypothetical protein
VNVVRISHRTAITVAGGLVLG